MPKNFPNPDDEQKSAMSDGFFKLGFWTLFGHPSFGFGHSL
jgi:hypothetical protein